MMTARLPPLILLVVVLLVGFSTEAFFAISARAYFGPTVDSDEISTSAQGGAGFFLQTLSCTDHFVLGDQGRGYLLNEAASPALVRRAVGEEHEKEQRHRRELLDLSWMLGYAYYRSSAHDPASGTLIYDEAHAIELGLAWEAGGLFDLTAAGAYQVVPAENYSQGIYDLNAAWTIPLVAEQETFVRGNPRDAAAYYENLELAREQVHVAANRRFPNLQLGLHVQLQVHTKSTTTSGRGAGSAITSDQTLNASATGPELVLHVSPRLKFRFAGMFYLYGSSPAALLANTTIGGIRSKADLAVADFEGTTAFLLLFPKRTYSAAGTLWLNRAVNLSLILAGATYDATGVSGAGLLNHTVSAGTLVDWAFAPHWKFGIAGDYTAGNASYDEASGGLKLGFAL